MITLNVVTIMRRICEEVESVLDCDFTDLNMRLGVVNLTHHMLNVESFCSSAVKATLDSEHQLIFVLTETEHTVLIDKYWLQAAILVMSSSDETLVLASFLGADSVIRKGIAHAKSAVTVCTGMKRHGRSFANLVELLPGWSLLLVLSLGVSVQRATEEIPRLTEGSPREVPLHRCQ